ncbi:hypothetical protein BLNAU_15497 [Blattamonas nauphoetae]|uniref:DDE-1 domain-containing protein n=1 Tax=Blattamonas nauphoetae TaxID=2049346 RepID=A0ABQ9XE75_9EUKA|nr:hypothetical protein BLNAU_15497 [Blattamonas nauphoetae]
MNVDVKAEIVRLFAEQEGHDGANRTEMICRFHSQHDFRAKDVIEALHIPSSTFYDGMKSLWKGYTPGKRGPHSKLRYAEDILLKNWVDERCRAGRLPTPNDVTTQANTILIEHNQNENPPPQLGRSCGYSFLNRQPNVEIVTPTSFNIYHVCSCTKPFIRPWFDQLEQFLETVHIPPHLFFNMDETHLHTVAHLTPEVATTTPDIDIVFITPNTSRFTQPVDQSINATFRNIISQTIPDHLAVAAADHRQSFMQTFLRATDSALSHRSIQHSFSVCGLHPFNSQIALCRVPNIGHLKIGSFPHTHQSHFGAGFAQTFYVFRTRRVKKHIIDVRQCVYGDSMGIHAFTKSW